MDLISDRVLHYGRFNDALDKVTDLMRSEYPSSVIIRGNPGSGKKTIIDEAIKITNVKCVSISPQHYNDDYIALKDIATELGYTDRGSTISDLMSEIRKDANGSKKSVIVLEDFEELCSQRQSLLYNLMNLIHTSPIKMGSGPNITLIGLTCNLEWAENLEKRVRSRLNAKCINLKLPYSKYEEYIEFASLLLGGYKIQKEFREQLKYMYWFTSRSIRSLKRYLLSICDVDENNELIVEFDPEDYRHNYLVNRNNMLRERLRHLTQPQLDLMKLAVYYCHKAHSTGFTLALLASSNVTKECKAIDLNSKNIYIDAALLVKLRLFKPHKVEQAMGLEAIMYPAVTSKQFKAVVDGDKALQFLATDKLWKSL